MYGLVIMTGLCLSVAVHINPFQTLLNRTKPYLHHCNLVSPAVHTHLHVLRHIKPWHSRI